MPEHSNHDTPGDVRFHNLLARAYHTLRFKPFATIEDDESSLYADYVQYRVQRDLFELVEDESPGIITWDNFRLIMRGSWKLRDNCMTVICRRMETAFHEFDFTGKDNHQFRGNDEPAEDMLRAARLFSESDGLVFMSLFLLFAELEHFEHLRDTVRPGYKWEAYYRDLLLGGELWEMVITAFQDAVKRLDFKPDWLEVGLDGL